MTLPRSSINALRSNLDRALSAKDPAAIATAVDVPLRNTNVVGGPSGGNSSSSGSVHREQLKVDGVDWSNVLNYLLDVHLAIASVSSPSHYLSEINKLSHNSCTGKYIGRWIKMFGSIKRVVPNFESDNVLHFYIVLYNARGLPVSSVWSIHPSDIPHYASFPRCRWEPSAPTFICKLVVHYLFFNVNSSRPNHLATILLFCLFVYSKNDLASTYEAQSSLHSALNHNLSSTKGNWLIPGIHTVCRNTHRTAALADEYVNRNAGTRNDHKRLQSAVTLLQASYSKTLNDRVELRPNEPLSEEGSKKVGVLYIVNQLFSMYFQLNTLRLCKNLLKPVESRSIHESGTMGEMVTYRYYVGRLNMFEDQYELAEQNFDYALKHCHKSSVANKKRILNYLIPVKLLRGRLPTNKREYPYSTSFVLVNYSTHYMER